MFRFSSQKGPISLRGQVLIYWEQLFYVALDKDEELRKLVN